MRTIEVDGIEVAYERVGHGPPLVLLHGYVGDGPATWAPQLDDLADEWTVIAWDAPGAGRSADPPESFGIAGYADCLAGFIAGLGLDRPHVAGVSFGGALALALCARHPTIPRSLVLASAYAGWRGSLPNETAEQRLAQALQLSALPAADFVATLLPTMFRPGTSEGLVSAFGATMAAFHPAGFRAMARAATEDLRPILPRVTVPTLLIYGADDVRAPRPVADHLHISIRGSVLTVLPDTGHVVNLERPAEFNAAVRAFLADLR